MGIPFGLIFERTMFFLSGLCNWFVINLIVSSLFIVWTWNTTKLLPRGSKVSYILRYKYKNLGLNVSFRCFLKRKDLLYSSISFDFNQKRHWGGGGGGGSREVFG